MRITEAQIAAACLIAGQVYDGHLKRSNGIAVLSSEYGINPASAGDFINDYKCLVQGRVFHRAMSAPAMRHFIQDIFDNRDVLARNSAVAALRLHIAYFEGHYKITLHAMRNVADHFGSSLQQPRTAAEIEAEFSAAVEKSLSTPQADRLKRLARSSTKPATVSVQSTVYVRNPDVVAETLFRAEGRCEGCASSAPFKRAKDGTPYLEVHHKVQLAMGGHDSVENAIALCPNCHRWFHYGIADA